MARNSSGPKNEPQYSSTGAPADAADMTELGAYAALVGNRKAGTNATRTALTGADVWDGLEFHETDTACVYARQGGNWVLDRVIGAVMSRVGRFQVDNVANATTLGTLALPALPVATRIAVTIEGVLGFSGSTQLLGVDITASAGTLNVIGNTGTTVATPNWGAYAQKAYVDLPANTALTVTFKTNNSSGAAYFRVTGELRVLLTGQY